MAKLDPNDLGDDALRDVLARGTPPPGDPDAEATLIATCIVNPALAKKGRLVEEDFFGFGRGMAYQRMSEGLSSGLTSEMEADLTNGVSGDEKTWRLAHDRILDASIRRKAHDLISRIGSGPDALGTLSGIIRNLTALERRACDEELKVEVRKYRDVLAEVGTAAIKNPVLKHTGEPTGVILDKLTGGFRSGEYWIVAGATNLGKSWLVNHLLVGWAKLHPGKAGLLCTTEMSEGAMAARSLSTWAKTTLTKLFCNDVKDKEAAIKAAIASFPDNMYLASVGCFNVDRIRTLCASIPNLGAVVVDLASGLRGLNASASGYDRLTEISNSLQALANEMKICVIGVVQLNKTWYANREGEPDRDSILGAVKGTGAWYEDPDVFISVTSGKGGAIRLGVEKNRRTGKMGAVDVLRGDCGEIMEVKEEEGL